MRKNLIILALTFITMTAHAQIEDHAIGIRFGFGGGISYQHKFSKVNRGELNAQFGTGGAYTTLRLTGIYHWVFRMQDGFHFYVGPGLSTGSLQLENNYAGDGNAGFFVSVGGQLGVDYVFDGIPVQLSVDILPMVPVVNNYDQIRLDPALGVRYVF